MFLSFLGAPCASRGTFSTAPFLCIHAVAVSPFSSSDLFSPTPRARKSLAAESSLHDRPTRSLLPLILRVDQTVGSALTALASMRVQSAPLVQMHSDNTHYDAQCFLSVGDIVLGFLERVNAAATASSELPVLQRMAELTLLGQAYAQTPLRDVRSRWDGTGVWAAATPEMTLLEALHKCLRIGADAMEGAPGGEPLAGSPMLRQCPHRFAVIDAGGMVTDIVAQSDVAMYIRRNRDILDPSIIDATVKSLGLGTQGGRRITSMSVSTPVIDCFYEMERANVQAVAIVDDGTDVLVGNLSESDIATLSTDAFGAYALPVGEFLVHTHGITPIVPPRDDRVYSPQSTAYGVALAQEGARLVVSCQDAATVGEVLELMHVRAVHRVWVVDDARRPIGVISLADILAVVSIDDRAISSDSCAAKITGGESESIAA